MKSLRIVGIGIMVVGLMFSALGEGFGAEKKFPTKPIQVIIPFQPGDTDNLLRPFVEKMPEYLNQPVTLVYKPGAAGSLGAGFVASSKPDGYLLVGTSQSSILIVPLTSKDLNYTWESFAPVSCLVEGTFLFAVKSDARWKNLKELVEDAKKNPDKITYTSSGTFGIVHIDHSARLFSAGILWEPAKQKAFGFKVFFHGQVIIQVVPREIGEDGRPERATSDPLLIEGMGGYFHDDIRHTGVGHLPQNPHEIERFRCCNRGRKGPPGEMIINGADDAGTSPGDSQD